MSKQPTANAIKSSRYGMYERARKMVTDDDLCKELADDIRETIVAFEAAYPDFPAIYARLNSEK